MNAENAISRVAQLDRAIIQHPAWIHAKVGIENCVAKSRAYREPLGCLLLADGGMGKTTICRAILSQMPLSTKIEERFEKTIIPAFYAEIPSPATVKTVAASLLAKLHDPNPLAGTTAQMTKRLIRLLAECETQLVFLDEFHQLFDIQKSTTRVNTLVCDWIKSLVNNTKVSFCLVGLAKFAPILSADSQLARRFPLQFELGALNCGSVEQPGTLISFLGQLKLQVLRRLQLKDIPHLDRRDIALRILAATAGNPAFIMSLVKESGLLALRKEANGLTLGDFADAWDTGITAKSSLTRENPFRMSDGQLAAAIRSEA